MLWKIICSIVCYVLFIYTCTILRFLEFVTMDFPLQRGTGLCTTKHIWNVGSTAGKIRKERKAGWKCVLFVINTCDVCSAVFWYEEIKSVIMLNWATRHEDVLGSGSLASRILNLGTWMRWMVGSAPRPLYYPRPPSPPSTTQTPERATWYPLR